MAVGYIRRGRLESPLQEALTPGQASFRYWASLFFVVLSFGAGGAWDRSWHTHNRFDDFYSPPHIFIYTTFAVAALTFLSLAMSPERRAWFGEAIRIPRVPLEAPAALFLALAGFGIVMFGGMMDMFWHNTFGLDETNWSTPHSTLGWGFMLTWFGFLATRLAFARHVPISRPFVIFAAVLSFSAIVGRALGAMQNYPTVDIARALGSLNVLASSTDFQHTLRIVQKYNITYSNPLFVPLASLGAGAGLALVWDLFAAPATRGRAKSAPGGSIVERSIGVVGRVLLAVPRFLTHGKMGFLTVALLVTFFSYTGAHGRAVFLDGKVPALQLLEEPKNFLPLPYVLGAAGYLLMIALGRSERWAWLAGGFLFGLVAAAFWDQRAGMAMIAAPLMLLGANLGHRAFTALREPGWPQIRVLAGAALAAPMVTGVADLYMRWTTP